MMKESFEEGSMNQHEEDMLEFRKMRTENNLFRQRINRLTDDNSILSNELSSMESDYDTICAHNGPEITRELFELRKRNQDVRNRLNEAYETIQELSGKISNGIDHKAIQVDDQPTIEHIHLLQEEVMEARSRDADFISVIKELKIRAQELELANEKLRNTPSDHCVAGLQQELAEIKMRESEANRLLNETRHKIKALHEDWEGFISKRQRQTDGPITSEEIQEQIMGACIREADALAESKETRQRVMELETQNHVIANQLRRQDDEYKKVQSYGESWPRLERELQCQLRQVQHKVKDSDARTKEQAVLARLKEAELLEIAADLKHQISDMESSYFEKWTQEELNKDADQSDASEDDEMFNEHDSMTFKNRSRDFQIDIPCLANMPA